ncbi:MAG: LLM class flavin-dependent oxidoreductase [Candidatus Caldarchaeum sp.]
MVKVSVAVEGDKTLTTYLEVASQMDGRGFYSLQFYEHVPYRPAWALAFSVAYHVRMLKLGPVTVPARLYSPKANARFLALLDAISPGGVLGVSRGAYMDGEKARLREVVETVEKIVDEYRRITWSTGGEPEIYVGTSGPLLAKTAASCQAVKAIVVDNLANPDYVRRLRQVIDQAGRRDLQLVARPFTCISVDGEDVETECLKELKKYLPDLVGDSPMVAAAGLRYEELRSDDPENERKMLESFAVCGDVEQVLEKTAKLVEAGADHICYGHPLSNQPVEAVRLIAGKIIPYFAGRG